MSNINEINNILSSVQMDRKDKSKLAKLLKNVGTNGASDVDVISVGNKEIDEIIELYQKGIESDNHPLFTDWGIPCYVNAYADESYKEFTLRTIWPDYDRMYIDYREMYGEEFYEGTNAINYDEEIILDNNEITFQFKTFDECATHNFYLVVLDEEGTYKINLNCYINNSGIITCIGDLNENEIIKIELDFNNYSTSYEIITKENNASCEPVIVNTNNFKSISTYNTLLDSLGKVPVYIKQGTMTENHLVVSYRKSNNEIEMYINLLDGSSYIYVLTNTNGAVTYTSALYVAKYYVRNGTVSSTTNQISTYEYRNIIIRKNCTIQLCGDVSNIKSDDKYIYWEGEIKFEDTLYDVNFNIFNNTTDKITWSTDSVLDFKANHTYVFRINRNYRGVIKEYANA